MTIRKTFFWLHLIMGCAGGIVILLMSVTGVLLTYEKQILARVERGAFAVDPPLKDAPRMPVEEMLRTASAQRGGLPSEAMLTLRSDTREPAEISVGREGSFYVNPYTGAVLGEPSREWRSFFQKVTVWHRYIGAEGEGRATAKAITGACNLAFLGLVLSGIYMWLPKKWTRQHLMPITWFRGGLSGKARDFNWHNVFGIWLAVPLFFVIACALPMSYSWADSLIYRITGTEAPARGAGKGPGGKGGFTKGNKGGRKKPAEARPPSAKGAKPSSESVAEFAGLNQLWQNAEKQAPVGWKTIAMRVPESATQPVSFSIDTGTGGQPQTRSTLMLDRSTGSIVRLETFDSLNAGRRLRSWTRFVHTGEAFGIAGQTLAGVASFGGVMLVWTGISLALRRLARKLKGGKQSQPARVWNPSEAAAPEMASVTDTRKDSVA